MSRNELKGIGNLKDQGLVVNARVLSIEQTIAELEGKVLDMETASLRAKQDIAKADAGRDQPCRTTATPRSHKIASRRKPTSNDAQPEDRHVFTNLMTEALARAPGGRAQHHRAGAPTISYAIVRTTDGKAAETPADENTPVLPGDVVKVGIVAVPATSN